MKTKFPALVLIIVAFALLATCYLTGCTTTGQFNTDKFAVLAQGVTVEVASELSPRERIALKHAVAAAAQELAALSSGDVVTVDSVSASVRRLAALRGQPAVKWANRITTLFRLLSDADGIVPAPRLARLAVELNNLAALL